MSYNKGACLRFPRCCPPRRSPAAPWIRCLQRSAVVPQPCPKVNIPGNNVDAPNCDNISANRVHALKCRTNGGRWRKVCWRRFMLLRKTAAFRESKGCIGGIPGTAQSIAALPLDDPQLGSLPVTCKSANIIFNPAGAPPTVL